MLAKPVVACNFSSMTQRQWWFSLNTVDVSAWMNNYIPFKTTNVITFPCHNLRQAMLMKVRLPLTCKEIKIWYMNITWCLYFVINNEYIGMLHNTNPKYASPCNNSVTLINHNEQQNIKYPYAYILVIYTFWVFENWVAWCLPYVWVVLLVQRYSFPSLDPLTAITPQSTATNHPNMIKCLSSTEHNQWFPALFYLRKSRKSIRFSTLQIVQVHKWIKSTTCRHLLCPGINWLHFLRMRV